MALTNIVMRSQLRFGLRIDAEHYSSRFLPVLNALEKCETKRLRATLTQPVITGHTPSKSVKSYYEPGTVKFIKTDNVREDLVRSQDAELMSDLGDAKLTASQLRAGDVIITIIGATEKIVGRAARVRSDMGRANINQNVALIRSTIPAGYLTTFLNTRYGREQIIWMSRQTGQVNLNCREVEEILIPDFTPDFVGRIEKLNVDRDELLKSARLNVAKAQTQLLTALNLHDWQPPRVLTWTRDMSQVVSEARCDAEHFSPRCEALRNIIRNHTGGFERLTDLAHISTDTTHPGITPDECFNYVELASIDPSLGVIESPSEVTGRSAPNRARMVLRSGDVLVASVEGSIEKTAIVGEDLDGALASTGFFVLRTQRATPEYLLALCQSFFVREQLKCEASGTILTAIAANRLPRVLIPRLAPDEEAAIGALVSQSHAARKSAQELLQRAKSAVEIAIESGEAAALEWLNVS